jgi:hypothetical protein
VVIQEDNHGPHLKARQLLQPEIQQQGIVFVNHPGNSTVQRAKDLLMYTWQSKDFDDTVKGKVCRAVYVELAKRCKMVGGSNHFKDDVYIHPESQ